MSAELPTEEDVLAELLLLWLEGQGLTHDVPDDMRWTPMAVGWAAWDRIQPNPSIPTIEAAIADSERRIDLEIQRDAVVNAAHMWRDSLPSDTSGLYAEDHRLLRSLENHLAAIRALEGK